MSDEMRHAGMHWPTGGEHPDRRTIYNLPGVSRGVLVMLADSARYWYEEAMANCPVVIWRGLPRPGKRPAELGWNPRLVADECLNLWDEASHDYETEYFTPLNELQFEAESGGQWLGFRGTALFLEKLRKQLRSRLPASVKLVYPAWCPDQPNGQVDAPYDAWREWLPLAMNWDVFSAHVYNHRDGDPSHGGAENIARTHKMLRDLMWQADPVTGGDKLIVYTEWNSNDSAEMDRSMLEAAGRVCVDDPKVLGYGYYIWQTQRQGEVQLSVWGNGERLAMFQDPPVLLGEEEPVAKYRKEGWRPKYQDILEGSIQVSNEGGNPRRRLLGLCLAESGFGLDSFDRWQSIERSKRMAAAIDAEQWDLVEDIFDEVKGGNSNDFSFGPCHPAYWWQFTAEEQREHPEWRHDLPRMIEFRARQIEDHGMALRMAAAKLDALEDDPARAKILSEMSPEERDQQLLEWYNKPNGPVTAGVRANYQRSLAEADRVLKEWDLAHGGEPNQPPPPPPSGTEYVSMPIPAIGTIQTCKGVILHGSGSGRQGNPLAVEALGTARYAQSNGELGWNATAGPGIVYEHLDVRTWGWNARRASSTYVAIEIANPTRQDDSSPCAVAVADYIFDRVWPVWGEIWHFPSHAEVEQSGETGYHDGKDDLYPAGSDAMTAFRELVYERLRHRQAEGGSEPRPGPEPTGDTIESLQNLVGNAYHEDGVIIKALTQALDTGDWGQVEAARSWLRENNPHKVVSGVASGQSRP